jgi:hypothetical protein
LGKSIKGRAISAFNVKLEYSFILILIKEELYSIDHFDNLRNGDNAVVLNHYRLSYEK